LTGLEWITIYAALPRTANAAARSPLPVVSRDEESSLIVALGLQ
jgi:hypothetical protein